MTYSVLLLGLGQIGMGYDYDAADNTLVLTHARAFFEHPAFVLSGGIDIDAESLAELEALQSEMFDGE